MRLSTRLSEEIEQGERRSKLRARESRQVWVRDASPQSTFQRGESLDMSHDGLRLKLRMGLSRGTEVVVSMKLDDTSMVTYTGRVLWSRPNAERTSCETGLLLENSNSADELRYGKWLQGRACY